MLENKKMEEDILEYLLVMFGKMAYSWHQLQHNGAGAGAGVNWPATS